MPTQSILKSLVELVKKFGAPKTYIDNIKGEDYFGLEIFYAYNFPNSGECIPVVDSIKFIAKKLGDRYLLKKICPIPWDSKEKEENIGEVEAIGEFSAEKIAKWRLETLAVQFEEGMCRLHRDFNRAPHIRKRSFYNPN